MFDQLENTYANIIMEFGIVGYSESDIMKRGLNSEKNLPLNLLYSYPHQENEDLEIIFQMMFPDEDHKIQSPKFFSLTLTNEKGNRTFLYCLKFPEKYVFPNNDLDNNKTSLSNSDKKVDNENSNEKIKKNYIEVPLVIYIKSHKEDLESFKQLLYAINQIIVNDNLEKIIPDAIMINNYKKIQLYNLLYFLFSLPHTSPHTLIKLQLNKELDNILNINPENKNNETIDFYFSSNCEIPCNKNDTDINILFLILDQSIIIKVLFSILTEKQIIFTASQAYLLHLIISCFLKLIFPFKWRHSCITVLTRENLELLEIPGSYIFGVLSSHLSTKDLTDEFSGKIIVDCDTNEIFGYSNFEPYEPPEMPIKKPIEDKKKKSNKKDKEKEVLEINNLESNNFTQGKNLIIINKNTIMKYQNELFGKKKKLIFNYDNNIIIDTQKSQLFIDKNDIFIDSSDWKWLRRYIQLVRNPEIFNLDNIDFKNKKGNRNIFSDEDNPILPNRPFSYNIQNIILTFILKKLTFQESDFMTVFKKTNLYSEYEDNNKEFENTKGSVIVQNIEETKNKPRSIDNSFNIEYELNQFNVDVIIDKIKTKINNFESDRKNNENVISYYQELKKILNDYLSIKEEISNQNNNNDEYTFIPRKLNERKKTISGKRPNLSKPSNKNLLRHIKNNTSLLQETSGQNKYILFGFDKDLEDSFQFYSKKGFIFFANELDKFLTEEKIDIKNIIYINNLNNQILSLIKKSLIEEETEEKNNKENLSDKKESKDVGNLEKIKLRQIIGVSIVPEKKEEEKEENDADKISNGSVEIKKEEDYDFAENLLNINLEKNQIFDWNNDNVLLDEANHIINFPEFNLEEELNKQYDNNEIKDENEINHLMQFYLFLAFYLDNAKKDETSLNFFFNNLNQNNYISKSSLDDIKNNKDNNDNNELYEIVEKDEADKSEEKKKINEIIIKLYILAYNNSDKKHRDFPYFSYYKTLKQIDSEDLKSLNSLFDSYEGEYELSFIYRTVIIEKQQAEMKKFQKMLSLKNKTKSYKINEEINLKDNYSRKSDINIVKKKIKSPDQKYNRQTIQNSKVNFGIDNDSSDNVIHLRTEPNINKLIKNEEVSLLIINDIGEIINEELNNIKDSIKSKNTSEILEEMNSRFKLNEKLKDLVNNLKFVNLDNINTKKKCFTFWLNCFNYLIIYTIVIEKLNLIEEKMWKKFFNTLYINIGDKIFSFNDIQYILFKKAYFFSSAYKPKDYIKKLNIEKINGELKLEEKEKLIPFILYLPINEFLKPTLYNEENIENDIVVKMAEYLNKNIILDEKNYLCCSDLFFKFYSNIFGKEIKKYEVYFNPELFKVIKNKKYKKIIQKKIKWQLNFENLI